MLYKITKCLLLLERASHVTLDSVAKNSHAAVACVTWHCKCDFESKSAWIVANEFTQFPFRFSSKINLPQWQITCLYNLVELTSQAGHRDLPEIEGMCDKSKFTFPDCSIWKNLWHCGVRLRKRLCGWRQAPSVACLIDYSSTKVNSSAPGKNKDTPKHIQGALCRTCTLCSVHTRTCQIGKTRNFEKVNTSFYSTPSVVADLHCLVVTRLVFPLVYLISQDYKHCTVNNTPILWDQHRSETSSQT